MYQQRVRVADLLSMKKCNHAFSGVNMLNSVSEKRSIRSLRKKNNRIRLVKNTDIVPKILFTNKSISITTLLRKYLLTSPPEADQREVIFPSLAKRGEGRFYGIFILADDLLMNYQQLNVQ